MESRRSIEKKGVGGGPGSLPPTIARRGIAPSETNSQSAYCRAVFFALYRHAEQTFSAAWCATIRKVFLHLAHSRVRQAAHVPCRLGTLIFLLHAVQCSLVLDIFVSRRAFRVLLEPALALSVWDWQKKDRVALK